MVSLNIQDERDKYIMKRERQTERRKKRYINRVTCTPESRLSRNNLPRWYTGDQKMTK